MEYKFPWQERWLAIKKQILENLKSDFPEKGEFSTIATLNQLPEIDRKTTFSFKTVKEGRDAFAGKNNHDIYLRLTNPTIRRLENTLTLLEARHFFNKTDIPELPELLNAGNVKTLVFSCGMAAISHTLFALLNPGDIMINDKVLYGCTDNLFNIEFKKKGIRTIEIDASKIEEVEKAFKDNPEAKLIYFETPSNPTMSIKDIKKISEIASKYNALVITDNTFATPYLQNPLRLGADIVIHSLTKYIGGHGDLLGGSVTGPGEFISGNEQGGLFYTRRVYGGVMDPAQVILVLRGIISLSLRMEKHCDNAEKVVSFLKQHPKIKKVYYPGLEETGKAIAEKQMSRFGGMLAFEIQGNFESTEKAMNKLPNQEVGYLAVSLGLPHTVFEYPFGMTHFFVPEKERMNKGITDTLIRMSVGLEDSEKIITTLRNILED